MPLGVQQQRRIHTMRQAIGIVLIPKIIHLDIVLLDEFELLAGKNQRFVTHQFAMLLDDLRSRTAYLQCMTNTTQARLVCPSQRNSIYPLFSHATTCLYTNIPIPCTLPHHLPANPAIHLYEDKRIAPAIVR